MTFRTNLLSTILLTGVIAPQAFASDPIEIDADLGFVFGALDVEGGVKEADVAVNFGIRAEKDAYLDNGTKIGAVIELRAESPAGQRPGFSGNFRVQDDTGFGLRAPATGIALSDNRTDSEGRASFEQAYVYAKNPWGEVSLGRDQGAAARLDARAPKVLNYAHATSPTIDLSGASIVRSRNDVTGPSAKITYVTPRILGLRAGGSYTPKAEARGLDFDNGATAPGLENADLENVFEAALSFDHVFRSDLTRVRVGLTSTIAEPSSVNPVFKDYTAWGAGLEVEKGNLATGIRYLHSNNAVDNGAYEAVEAGLVYYFEDWTVGAEIGAAQDDLLNIDGSVWSLSAKRNVSPNISLGFAYTDTRTSGSINVFRNGSDLLAEGKGVLIELTVRK